ncbi:NAD(+) synthase (plasmid) [Mesorhizobium sp. NBSH29]|uniref:NAD(+) synthase n=1 Tax=Mesorhizobium sp. NBSH29 TaxID=2654249 RepID=UPI001896A511|nr:NAD(+) synthase [Mesorhizobium sp. NBSH29]QPC89086.1 NAD(+) synthase [Mesorhizobium sp. NBSH29]
MNMMISAFELSALSIDAEREAERIASRMRDALRHDLRKRGFVIGISGGIDSAVCTALAVRAVGPARVFGLLMPEHDSDPDSLRLGTAVAETFGIENAVEDIGPTLEATGCYRRRDDAIREVVPDYGAGWSSKIVFDSALTSGGYNISSLVVRSPDGQMRKLRLPAASYLGVVASTNMKQRTRKQLEYYHADRLNFAVIGTPNLLEYDQGFFVKNGDGAADIKPIAHLYKSQVYALAAHLGVPAEIRKRPPTTDTYSLPQTQEEFYFSLPYAKMDACLYALDSNLSASQTGAAIGLSEAQVEAVWSDIAAKRKVARYLHMAPVLVE